MKLTTPKFDSEELQLVQECLSSGWVTQGPMTQKFETLFAARHQVPYALAISNCTAALHIAMMALGIGPGDEVIVPAYTWVTSASCAEYVGAKAVFADIDLDTYNLDPAAFEAAITPRTRAVVVVHEFGHAAPMDEIMAIARRHNIKVVEDAACGVGVDYNGIMLGGIGDIGCFSLHPRKIITTGEGGVITVRDSELANKVMSLRNHGSTGYADHSPEKGKPYYMGSFDMIGYNFRLSDIQSAVGVAQMGKLDALLEERKHCAMRYHELLDNVVGLSLPHASPKSGHSYQSYVVRVTEGGRERRNRIMDVLASQNIETRPGTHAVHRLGYYARKYGLKSEMFPNACLAEDTSITLPIFPGMTGKDQESVASTIASELKSG